MCTHYYYFLPNVRHDYYFFESISKFNIISSLYVIYNDIDMLILSFFFLLVVDMLSYKYFVCIVELTSCIFFLNVF